ncbi:competence protein CoiA family protein [Lysinibacillus fusiformis]|uniref:competence protein CoiA family protein n=1 Tax=Lysinibacillus fusiformis TaxID=28031 RepID=UPI00263B7AF2|nr:hypothetical protein [Lysinibacillus fusiformis]MDC6267338.1 hypothetical protein [Lysinibacillus sphaericus]MDN4968228.1 hypothetical protein [Lysinibacillus fusiformis]MDN4968402.1 hypothetical protein [Lysinibacillus fusiformis]
MNINLWFARDNHGEIITILNSNITNTYTCPICNNEVIPKALESNQVTPHFAHIDRSKCTGESFIHFWMKHGFIERGDTFVIISDESHIFTCKDFKTEVTFNLKSGVYRPDIVIETECGNEIVFEMAHKNKKKIQDYIDRWIELDKIVVEVDTPTLIGQNEVKEFKALYYKGKCFNFNKRDGGYYNTIGKLKEEMNQNNNYDIELVKKLDWFWNELIKYKNDNGYKDVFQYYKLLLKDSNFDFINKIINKHKVCRFKEDFINYIIDEINSILNQIEIENDVEIEYQIELDKKKGYKIIYEINFNDKMNIVYSKKTQRTISIHSTNITETLTDAIALRNSKIDKHSFEKHLNNLLKDIDDKLNAEFELTETFISNEYWYNGDYYIRTYIDRMFSKDTLLTEIRFTENEIIDLCEKEIINEHISNTIVSVIIDMNLDKNKLQIQELYYKRLWNVDVYGLSNYLKYVLDDFKIVLMDNYFNEECCFIEVIITDDTVSLLDIELHKDNFDNKRSLFKELMRLYCKKKSYSEKFKCKDCSKYFEIKIDEIDFFESNELQLPKRCKSCRQKRKSGGIK